MEVSQGFYGGVGWGVYFAKLCEKSLGKNIRTEWCLDTDVRNNGLRSNLILKCIMIMSLMPIKKRWVAINLVVKSVKLHIAAVFVHVLMTEPFWLEAWSKSKPLCKPESSHLWLFRKMKLYVTIFRAKNMIKWLKEIQWNNLHQFKKSLVCTFQGLKRDNQTCVKQSNFKNPWFCRKIF